MSECMICSKECTGKTCSGACRAKLSRQAHGQPIVIPKRTRTTGCRVSIPGDEDYVGVCEKVDGAWRVNKQPSSNPCELTRIQIEQAIRAYPHDQWVNSPEHKELLRRLHSMTIEQLEEQGYHVPAWKVAV